MNTKTERKIEFKSWAKDRYSKAPRGRYGASTPESRNEAKEYLIEKADSYLVLWLWFRRGRYKRLIKRLWDLCEMIAASAGIVNSDGRNIAHTCRDIRRIQPGHMYWDAEAGELKFNLPQPTITWGTERIADLIENYDPVSIDLDESLTGEPVFLNLKGDDQ